MKVVILADNMVFLNCETTCPLGGDVSFIWKRDEYRVENNLDPELSEYLQLLNFSREDEGNYSCAVRGRVLISSPTVRLSSLRKSDGDQRLLTPDTRWAH